MLLAFMLAYLTFSNVVQVWHVVVLAFILGITNAFDAPSRQAIVKDLVGPEHLASGISVNSLIFNTARVFGPTVAGIALATVGAGWCFLLNGASFLAVIGSLWAIKVPTITRPASNQSSLQQLRDGLRFSRHHETIKPLLLLAAVTSVLSVNIMTQLPAFASTTLNSPIYGYSTLTTAQGIGAVLAGLLVVVCSRFGRGRVISVMLLVFCSTIFIASRVTDVLPAAGLMSVIGFSMVMMFVTMNTMIQTVVPDEYRGRVLSLYTLTFFGLNPFGALALGQIATVIGVPDAIALYAILNLVIILAILARWPALWQNK
jgi:MFS family permease